MTSTSISPNHREALTAVSTVTGKDEYLLSTNGALTISGGGGSGGGTSSTFGSAFPSIGTAIGVSNGTNMVAIVLGQSTMSASIPVTIASNQSSIPVAATLSAETTKVIGTVNQGTTPWVVVQQAATGTPTNVSASATSVTLLASNSARKGGSIFNDSTALLYVKFGTTASTTSFKVILAASAYYEIPAGYTGRIDGIWASATGTARIDEDS